MKVLVENSGIQLTIESLNDSIESSISLRQVNNVAENAMKELITLINYKEIYNSEQYEENDNNEQNNDSEQDEENDESDESDESCSEDDDDDDELGSDDIIDLENKNKEWEENCTNIKELIVKEDKKRLKDFISNINDVNTPIIIKGLKKNQREWSFKFFKSLNKDSIDVTTWSMKVNQERVFYIKLD